MSILACHAGHPSSIPGNGTKGGANLMSSPTALPLKIPDRRMLIALLYPLDSLPISKPWGIMSVVREAGPILPSSRSSALTGIPVDTLTKFVA